MNLDGDKFKLEIVHFDQFYPSNFISGELLSPEDATYRPSPGISSQ